MGVGGEVRSRDAASIAASRQRSSHSPPRHVIPAVGVRRAPHSLSSDSRLWHGTLCASATLARPRPEQAPTAHPPFPPPTHTLADSCPCVALSWAQASKQAGGPTAFSCCCRRLQTRALHPSTTDGPHGTLFSCRVVVCDARRAFGLRLCVRARWISLSQPCTPPPLPW